MSWTGRILAALLGCSCASIATAAQWVIDHEQSELTFIATLEGASFSGSFPAYEAQIEFDAAQPQLSNIKLTVKVEAVETGSADLNEGMAGPEWFNFAKFPQAQFSTTQIHSTGAGRYEASGALTIKGIARTLVIPFTWAEQGPLALMMATFTLRRTDFSIGTGAWARSDAVGFNVTVRANLALRPAQTP